MTADISEKAFEEAIEKSLITKGGYTKGNPQSFDREKALDTDTLISFIKQTQPKKWERYEAVYGSESENSFIQRFCKETDTYGLVSVLRKGFKDRGIDFRVCFFKPETSKNLELTLLYSQNILHCTRQLHYSVKNENSIDIVLFLNGIPLVTMELKDQFTGQSVSNAINQYKFDRASKDKIFEFQHRVLVHFAVDLCEVFMTTSLKGKDTYFLPFNQGSNGAGEVGGKGNPLNPDGFQTAYLWENVLCKDTLMEIIHKYIHYDKNKNILIFPRYHQLDVVTKLIADVKKNGSGKNYLIQHSAGSGKSNSIAWLAYRLSGLHKDDKKIFQSVIVVTDRRVLDSQLQDTIYQFDHVLGIVKKIDKNAKQLRDAINDGVQIIITTLQKFPVIFEEINSQNKSFAVIVDEAHSSQSGEAAKKLKKALADDEDVLEEYRKIESEAEENTPDEEDKLVSELLSHGQHKNLSFFAFTATPKEKTLQLFGDRQPDGTFRAFHIYSMRQAIEEGFILDVLKNYTTYSMYYKIAKKSDDDPELDKAKATKAVARFESLHPYNLAQKTAVMVEHFRNITMHKIGGKAKAMVVTSSRLHAVRYLIEFRKYIEMKGYKDVDVLVAFSGEVNDKDNEYTEEKLNKTKSGETIKENQLPKEFHDNFNVLIVAEKYQTGFDEPLLHTMFVDKKLYGVKAVQTLSRLNRICKGKTDTFVLDFVNTAEEIKESFQPYYEATVLESETDPNVIYDLKNGLDKFMIYQSSEVTLFADIFYNSTKDEKELQAKLISVVKPAADRYNAKTDEDKTEFKSSLATFIRLYSFIIQICRMFDKELQEFYEYAKYLSKVLPKDNKDKIDLSDELILQYYRLQKTSSEDILLESTDKALPNIKGGIGGREKEEEPLSAIIDKMNEKFGTSFTEQDKVLMQFKSVISSDEKVQNAAKSRDVSLFNYLFTEAFKNAAVSLYTQNSDFFMSMFNDENKMSYVSNLLSNVVYSELTN